MSVKGIVAPAGRINRESRGARLLRSALAPLLVLGTLVVSLGLTSSPASATGLTPTWTQLHPATSPEARNGAAMVYDPATANMVMFGGEGNFSTNDTWTFNGNDWTRHTPPTSPPARVWPSMAYDPATGNMVLFGGHVLSGGGGPQLNDTWTWDGNTWTQQAPTTSPPAVENASMAYDPAIGKMVLFGGYDGSNYRNDTWTWDGTNWTQLSPPTSPAGREGAKMAFDPVTGNLVLFGGANNSTFFGDTWTFDGTNWTQQSPATSPSGRLDATMAFDPATGNMVLFGGADPFSAGDTWTWNGITWTQQSPPTSPPSRTQAAMAFDPATGDVVLFGGINGGALNDTWTWGIPGAKLDWTQASPSTSPSARSGASMAYDPATGNMVLFGGFIGSGDQFVNETWTWDGTSWTRQSPATSPSIRANASMAYDPATGNMVLFGGGSSSNLNDTWTWDGTNWTKQSPATSPSTRSGASMAYDPATGNMVLFGGFNGSSRLNDTWTWDGTTWTQQSAATSPSVREGASMAFDPATANMVLFGGNASFASDLNDTWTWDGTTWSQQSPASSPSARDSASMAFDPASASMVLFGGIGPGGDHNDTWSWDGTNWTEQSPATSPPARDSAVLAYDPGAAHLVLFGGEENGGSVLADDTWTLGILQPPLITSADNTTFSVGSAGSYTVTTGGDPTATISESGVLPNGVSFTDNHDGTATLSGTADSGTGSSYSLTITASNGVSPDATQNFTLNVDEGPGFPLGGSMGHTWTTGTHDSFTIHTSGFPSPTIVHPYGQPGDGKLPNNLTFTDNGDGSATISGTPASNSGGTYSIQLVATNSTGSDTEYATITVQQSPVMAYPPSGATVGVRANTAFSQPWSVSAPATTWPHITQPVTYTTNGLPSSTTFNNGGSGSGTITGTLAKGTYGPITIKASNSVGSSSTSFYIKSQ